jgi:hypothetical protein
MNKLFYLIGIADDELLVVVTTVAFVNDAKKFDVNCEARAFISIDDTLISGPTKKNLKNSFRKIKIYSNQS